MSALPSVLIFAAAIAVGVPMLVNALQGLLDKLAA
jgi:hypothetical protein